MSFRLHATKASNGRLQLFALRASVFTLFPESNNPHPEPLQTTDGGAEFAFAQNLAAGHSPDGNEQLWVGGMNLAGTKSAVYTVHQNKPDHAWGSWHHFQSAGEIAAVCAVGQLSDGRMQAFVTTRSEFPCKIRTAWKVPSPPGSDWSTWQEIAAPPDSDDNGFMSGVIVGPLSDGRLQIWAKARKNPQSKTYLYTSHQTSTDPTVPWSEWQKFSTPPHHPGDESGIIGESELVDGRTHLWLVSPASTLQSIKQTSTNPDSGWEDWVDPFHEFHGLSIGPLTDFAAARRHDGTCQLWILFAAPYSEIERIYTSRQTGSNPVVWSAWTEQAQLQPTL
jgi:hypothetical protein